MPLIEAAAGCTIGLVIGWFVGEKIQKKKPVNKPEEKIIDIDLIVSMIESGDIIDKEVKHKSETVILWMCSKNEDLTIGYTARDCWTGEPVGNKFLIKKNGLPDLAIKITDDEFKKISTARQKFLGSKIKESLEQMCISNAKDAVEKLG